jgi:hypothetical protein
MVPKILFGGTPPRIDFAIFKQTTGVNIIDVPAQQGHALGEEGQLAGVISEIGNTLRRTLDATLDTMKPGQSVRVQILVHGTAGFEFAGSGFGNSMSFSDQASFVFGNMDTEKSTIHPVKLKLSQNEISNQKKIIILAGDQFVEDSNQSQIRHPHTGNDGSDIIDLK